MIFYNIFFYFFQDFTHSLLATAKLATFHAVSYCMREDEDLDFLAKYPFLNEDPVYRPATKKLFTRAQNSLAKRMHNIFLQQNEVCWKHFFFLRYILWYIIYSSYVNRYRIQIQKILNLKKVFGYFLVQQKLYFMQLKMCTL